MSRSQATRRPPSTWLSVLFGSLWSKVFSDTQKVGGPLLNLWVLCRLHHLRRYLPGLCIVFRQFRQCLPSTLCLSAWGSAMTLHKAPTLS